MKIPVSIVVLFCAAIVGLQSWTLAAVVDLKTEVAVLKATLSQGQHLATK